MGEFENRLIAANPHAGVKEDNCIYPISYVDGLEDG